MLAPRCETATRSRRSSRRRPEWGSADDGHPAQKRCFGAGCCGGRCTSWLLLAGVCRGKRQWRCLPRGGPPRGGGPTQVLVQPGESVTSGKNLARLTAGEGQDAASGVMVRAPAAGVVTSASAVVGNVASAQAEPLFRIAGQGEMELLAEIPVRTLARLAVDQSAKVEIIGVGELPGKVRLFSGAINPTTQLGQVRIFVGSDSRLRAGAFGRATVQIGQRCAPAIPLSAVLYGPGGAVVQVARSGRIESRRVCMGLLEKGQAEVRKGLAESETVVGRAGEFHRNGDRVRAVTATETSAR